MNGLASAIRGTGNMLVPSLAICIGVVLLVPLSPLSMPTELSSKAPK